MDGSIQGVFLFRVQHTNAGLVTTFLLEDGRIENVYFKGGAKRSHNLFPLAHGELTVYQKSAGSMPNLTAFDLLDKNYDRDPLKMSMAFFVAELFLKCNRDFSDTNLYGFMLETIHQLDQGELKYFPHQFILQQLEISGIKPLLEIEKRGQLLFDISEGVIGGIEANEKTASARTTDLLVNLMSGKQVESTRKERRVLLDTLIQYLHYHMPGIGTIKSYDVIKDLLS
jgi:hypothetical protein